MNHLLEIDRRHFLSVSATAATAVGLAPSLAMGSTATGNLHLATFRFDVTPPMGHALCGGWIRPVVGVDDPLEAEKVTSPADVVARNGVTSLYDVPSFI